MASKTKEDGAGRETRVASVVALWLDREGLPKGASEGNMRVLVVDDEDGGMERAIKMAGGTVQSWRRRATGRNTTGRRAALPWPASDPKQPQVDLAIVRLPRDWPAFALQIDAVGSRLAPGGRLWVVGANDEGIKSVPGHLPSTAACETLWIKRRVRILEIRDLPGDLPVRGRLNAWAQAVELDLPGVGPTTIRSYPGLFAHGRLDAGSRLLLQTVIESPNLLRPGGRVLDFGCGTGVLSVALAHRQPDAVFTLVDVDAVAVEAARHNLPQATVTTGDAWAAVDLKARFNLIISNPPLHRGHADDRGTLHALLQQAPLHLSSGGRLVLVSWKIAGVVRKLRETFGTVEILAEAGPYQVVMAS